MTKQIKLDYFYANNYEVDPDFFNEFDVYCGNDRRVYIRLNTNDDLSEQLADGTAVANNYVWEWIIPDNGDAIREWVDSEFDFPGGKEAEEFNRKNHG